MIAKILADPFYAGLIRDGDQLIPGRHEPVIDLEQWRCVERIRKQSSKSLKRAGRPPARAPTVCALARDAPATIATATSAGSALALIDPDLPHCIWLPGASHANRELQSAAGENLRID